MSALQRFFADRSDAWIIGGGLALTSVVLLAEAVLPAGTPIWVLHLVPIGFVTWYGRLRWGALLALVSLLPIIIRPGEFSDPSSGTVLGIGLAVRLGAIAALLWLLRHGKRAADRTAEGVRVDPSTGLANARALFDLIAAERERADRYGRPFTVAYVGLDNLSAVRARAGVGAANELLGRVALEIRGCVRSVDYVARLRESEFAIVLPETGPHAARTATERLRQALHDLVEGNPYAVTFSVGVLTWQQSEISVEALHQRVYQLMRAARGEEAPILHEILDIPVVANMLTEAGHA